MCPEYMCMMIGESGGRVGDEKNLVMFILRSLE